MASTHRGQQSNQQAKQRTARNNSKRAGPQARKRSLQNNGQKSDQSRDRSSVAERTD